MKKVKRWDFCICMVMILMIVLNFELINASAADGTSGLSITGYRTTNDGIIVYVKNASLASELPVVQIGSESCDKVESIKEITRKTLILLDNSKSISSSWQNEAVALISSVINEHAEGEKFKLVTYASGMTMWADYSDDYANLISVTQNIPFKKQESYLTDIFYELLASESKEESGAYKRIIIISDGADHNEITYTQDELKELIRKSGISINAVGVNRDNNADALNLLFSYARLTNGNSIVVKQGDDPRSAIEMLVHENISGFKLIPDQSMWDGSSKETKFTFSVDSGQISLRTVLEMPFAEIGSSNEKEKNTEPEEKIKPNTESDKDFDESDNSLNREEEKETPVVMIIAIIGGSIVLVSAVIIIIRSMKKKKQAEETKKWEYIEDDPVVYPDREFNIPDGSGGTVLLWSENEADKENKQKVYIGLTSSRTKKVFKTQIEDSIIIGRNTGLDISLGFDGTVSGKHCEIYRIEDALYIKDLNSSNGTYYNDTRIYEEGKKIQSGGKIRIGQDSYNLTIEYI